MKTGNKTKTVGVLFWGEPSWLRDKPPKGMKKTRQAYGLFSRIGKSRGFNVVIGAMKDYDKGIFKHAYEYSRGRFRELKDQAVDIIFDRVQDDGEKQKAKERIKKGVRMFNNPALNRICWDKYLCSRIFKGLMAETFLVNNKAGLERAVKKIRSEKIVLKPRYGIMGDGVMIVSRDGLPEVGKDTIVQRFIDSSKGIGHFGIKGVHDLRVVTISGRIDHSYIRRPRKGLIANIAQGGFVTHICRKLPAEVLGIVRKVDNRMKRYGPRMYTVDMMFDENGKIVVTELESIPVIDSAYKSRSAKPIQKEFINNIFGVLEKLT